MTRYDTIVIGAGLAGLTTACYLAKANQKVMLVSHGMGALLLASGCVDVLGFHPANSLEPVKNPEGNLDKFMADRSDHPYKFIGKENIKAGLDAFLNLVNPALDYRGEIDKNWLLPSGVGAIHPTCLAPGSLVQGNLASGASMLIVGFRQLRDFYPTLICQNINEQNLGIRAEAFNIDNVTIPAANKMNATPIELSNTFEKPDFRKQIVNAIKSKAKQFDRVGFPAVLGLSQHKNVVADLEKQLGKPVFEISALPPSVPGRRLYEALKRAFLQAGGRLTVGTKVADGTIENGQVTQIRIETVNRLKPLKANNYILATGGVFGGGIFADADGTVEETIFGLPVAANENRHQWFDKKFIAPNGQPVFNFGVRINAHLNPVNGSNAPQAENLYIAGAAIAGAEWTRGRTGDGIALSSAIAIAKQLAG